MRDLQVVRLRFGPFVKRHFQHASSKIQGARPYTYLMRPSTSARPLEMTLHPLCSSVAGVPPNCRFWLGSRGLSDVFLLTTGSLHPALSPPFVAQTAQLGSDSLAYRITFLIHAYDRAYVITTVSVSRGSGHKSEDSFLATWRLSLQGVRLTLSRATASRSGRGARQNGLKGDRMPIPCRVGEMRLQAPGPTCAGPGNRRR